LWPRETARFHEPLALFGHFLGLFLAHGAPQDVRFASE